MSDGMQSRYRLGAALLILVLTLAWVTGTAHAESGPVGMLYFTAVDCPHCAVVINEVLTPLQAEYGDQMQIKVIEISEPANYEMLIRAEEMFGVSAEERGLPTLIVGGQVLVGEDAIREQLRCLLDTCLGMGGASWPDISGLQGIAIEGQDGLVPEFSLGLEESATCGPEDAVACEPPPTIWAAYFYEVGCQAGM